jgi:hypothetical protein
MCYVKKVINNHMSESSNNNDQEGKQVMESEAKKPDDVAGISISGHIMIRDKETGEVLINKRS